MNQTIKRIKSVFLLSADERRANKAEKNFQNWLKKYQSPHTAGKINLTRVYTDKDGNNWYMLSNPLEMTKERADLLDSAVQESEYNIEKTELADKFKSHHDKTMKARELMKGRKYAEADELLQVVQNETADLKFRVNQLGSTQTILNIALLFFYVDDENPYQVNHLTQQRKRKLIEADDDLRAFFLRTCWDVYRHSTNVEGRDFLRYSTQSAKRRRKKSSIK